MHSLSRTHPPPFEESLQHPKVSFITSLDGFKARIRLLSEPHSRGVSFPYDVLNKDSDLHQSYLLRLCYAFRLSQSLDVLFHPCPLGLIPYRVRPWGWDSQRFPPTSSRHGFRRALPLEPLTSLARIQPR